MGLRLDSFKLASFLFYLKGSVVSKAPDTSCYRDGRNEKERHEDEEPEVVSSGHTVTHQHLEHQQQDVEAHCDQHGFELHTSLPFRPNRRKVEMSEVFSRLKLTNSPGAHF